MTLCTDNWIYGPSTQNGAGTTEWTIWTPAAEQVSDSAMGSRLGQFGGSVKRVPSSKPGYDAFEIRHYDD